MQAAADPCLRLIVAHLEHASSRLDPASDAPPRHERARECRIREVDREGIIQHAARP